MSRSVTGEKKKRFLAGDVLKTDKGHNPSLLLVFKCLSSYPALREVTDVHREGALMLEVWSALGIQSRSMSTVLHSRR